MKALPTDLNMPQESTQEAKSNEGSQIPENMPSSAIAIQEQNTLPNDDKEDTSATADEENHLEPVSTDKSSCIDLNHADLPTLMRLPGVGERRASDIMARRTKHPFRHKRDITRIKGIGPKTYARMKDLLCDP